MKIGDIVQRIPETFGGDGDRPSKRQKAAEEGAQAIHGDGDVHPPTEEIPRRQLPGARRRHPRELRRRMRQTTA